MSFVVDGDPTGLWWEPSNDTLYIADNRNNRILAWTEPGHFRAVAALPGGAPGDTGLGQLARLADGSFVVTRSGFGALGDVVVVSPDGRTAVVPNLDPLRRRVGLSVTSDGVLLDAWFVPQASGPVGSVAVLSLSGSETEWIPGLSMPVGVLSVGARVFVSDPGRDEILVADRADPARSLRRFAMVSSPGLLCQGPNGTLFSASGAGVVYQIASDGAVRTFDTGYRSVRGVAFDRAHARLFVADHDMAPTDGVENRLRIVPSDR